MVRIAAIYDIHGNLPALEAVLAEIETLGVDEIVVGGDVVPGPLPRETMDALLALDTPVQFIRGNGEFDTFAMFTGSNVDAVPPQARAIVQWTSEVLPDEYLSRFSEWPLTTRINMPGIGDVLFCHATPNSDRQIFTTRTPAERLIPLFESTGAAAVICGHTHMQFDRMIGRTRVMNAGSVGMPFGTPGAYWVLIGSEIELRRTAYDAAAAARLIRASGYPFAEDFARNNVEQPPAEAVMLEAFERAALRG